MPFKNAKEFNSPIRHKTKEVSQMTILSKKQNTQHHPFKDYLMIVEVSGFQPYARWGEPNSDETREALSSAVQFVKDDIDFLYEKFIGEARSDQYQVDIYATKDEYRSRIFICIDSPNLKALIKREYAVAESADFLYRFAYTLNISIARNGNVYRNDYSKKLSLSYPCAVEHLKLGFNKIFLPRLSLKNNIIDKCRNIFKPHITKIGNFRTAVLEHTTQEHCHV